MALLSGAYPLLGIALLINMQIAQAPFSVMERAVAPFLIPMIATLLLVTYIPEIVLFLPGLMR